MIFSRPAIERLIATVESGLQYGELGPYAQGLRDCLEEVARVTVELLRSTSDWGDLLGRIATVTDESFGPFPVQGPDENLTEIERGIFLQRQHIDNLEQGQGRLTVERDAMRPVVDAAEKWRDAANDDEDALLMSDLMCAIDAYRATKEQL